ncbi:alpha/beta fold hydrolase (plasmid) [Roseomonas sp. CCTCC AB2023176]|uniref:alpha/beta fold hydrolase n=1 Tax=Roseomonas sp. CCTCC AB2023176 TaxID=3342640 RepID=UPI0035E36B57
MRFPSQHGAIAGLVLHVADLTTATPLLRGVLGALGYGRTNAGPGWTFWAREGAQVLVREVASGEPVMAGVTVQLRAPDRATVDRLHAVALEDGWRVAEPPAEHPYAPGYYSVVLALPDGSGPLLEVVHPLSDLPEDRHGGERVRLPGADGVTLRGYLFRPAPGDGGARPGIVVLHGYGADATWTTFTGARLGEAGFAALCLSQRGWLGSEGDEDQGLRQPDDALAAAAWLRAQGGCGGPVAILGYSQGAQVALLAAARPGADLLGVVAFFPCTDLAAWAQEGGPAIADYLVDFVAPEHMAACSPVTVAHRIRCPVLLIHGDSDTTVPLSQSWAMVAANPAIKLVEVPGATHLFTPEQYRAGRERAVSFLRACLEGYARRTRVGGDRR